MDASPYATGFTAVYYDPSSNRLFTEHADGSAGVIDVRAILHSAGAVDARVMTNPDGSTFLAPVEHGAYAGVTERPDGKYEVHDEIGVHRGTFSEITQAIHARHAFNSPDALPPGTIAHVAGNSFVAVVTAVHITAKRADVNPCRPYMDEPAVVIRGARKGEWGTVTDKYPVGWYEITQRDAEPLLLDPESVARYNPEWDTCVA